LGQYRRLSIKNSFKCLYKKVRGYFWDSLQTKNLQLHPLGTLIIYKVTCSLLISTIISQKSFAEATKDLRIDDAKNRVLQSLSKKVNVYNNKVKRVVEISSDSLSLKNIFCDLSEDGSVLCVLSVNEDKVCDIGSKVIGVATGFGLIRGYLFGEPIVCSTF
jgi:hypothetical protein